MIEKTRLGGFFSLVPAKNRAPKPEFTTFPFLVQGLIFGMSSGFAPGPLLTLVFTETLRHGVKAGLKVATAPVVTDGPLILVTWLLLARFQHLRLFLAVIAFAGSAFLVFLAMECLRASRGKVSLEPISPGHSFKKGLLTNLLNPAPYLFWFTVGTPALLQAAAFHPLAAISFLVCFFGAITGAKVLVALLVMRFRGFLSSGTYRVIMVVMGLSLLVFAVLFFRDGLAHLGPG